MWKFQDLPYKRPDMDQVKAEYLDAIRRFKAAATYEEAREAYLAQDRILRTLHTAEVIASIRNTMDTTDPFYDAEITFFNQEMAKFMPLQKQLKDALLETPFRAEFAREYGEELFIKAELKRKTQSDEIVQDLIEESALEEAYKKTAASCKVEFKGQVVNFYGLLKYMEDPDREVRRAAFVEWAKLYEGVSEDLDAQYDQLVKIRVRIAKKLGFDSYIDYIYPARGRADYTAKDVESFRRQVREVIVPAANRYRKLQAKRIGVDKLRYYDENYLFPDGNADPVGGEKELIRIASDIYHSLSPETAEFFDFMVEHDLFDLTTRQGKHLGGYCTYIADHQAPFIFSNFNGTAADTGVLTHEAGHAFAGFRAQKKQPFLEYGHSTSEINEIHSMSMEHFAYPYMDRFFGGENVEKALYTHLVDAFSVIPYLVSVDEFQHRVFENPGMSATERRAVWRDIERTYLPWRDYDGVKFLEEGGFWMQKQHVFLYPFYYVDYALAQVCSFELYGRMKEDPKQAWADYLRLCDAGGSLGYFKLLKLANLSNPFEPGAVERAVGHVIEELNARQEAF